VTTTIKPLRASMAMRRVLRRSRWESGRIIIWRGLEAATRTVTLRNGFAVAQG